MNFIKNIIVAYQKYDIIFFFIEKYTLIQGKLQIYFVKFLYNGRFKIGKNFKLWGKIRFLIYGNGIIFIGNDFHGVSSRKRSFITLFSRIHLTIIGEGKIIIGDHVGLNGTTITARKKISIGDYTMIGPNTIIVDNDGHNAWPPRERWTTSGRSEEIIIENDVWIGMNCTILKGVKIGTGSIISAGRVVISNVEANSLYAGNPAEKIKSLNNN